MLGTSILWRSTVPFAYLIKSNLRRAFVYFRWSWSWSWSWSCYFGLGLKNVVLFTSRVLVKALASGKQVAGWTSNGSALRAAPSATHTHLCAYDTKQYNLLLAKGRWCSAARKVTVGAASLWSIGHVADTTLPTGWRATKGRQNPQQRSSGWDFFIWRL